jgi:hypothetical protein
MKDTRNERSAIAAAQPPWHRNSRKSDRVSTDNLWPGGKKKDKPPGWNGK